MFSGCKCILKIELWDLKTRNWKWKVRLDCQSHSDVDFDIVLFNCSLFTIEVAIGLFVATYYMMMRCFTYIISNVRYHVNWCGLVINYIIISCWCHIRALAQKTIFIEAQVTIFISIISPISSAYGKSSQNWKVVIVHQLFLLLQTRILKHSLLLE